MTLAVVAEIDEYYYFLSWAMQQHLLLPFILLINSTPFHSTSNIVDLQPFIFIPGRHRHHPGIPAKICIHHWERERNWRIIRFDPSSNSFPSSRSSYLLIHKIIKTLCSAHSNSSHLASLLLFLTWLQCRAEKRDARKWCNRVDR